MMQFSRAPLAACAFGAALIISGSAWAQQQQPPPSQQQSDNSRDRSAGGNETTISGCFTTDSSGQYTLTDAQSGSKVVVTNGAAIQRHANHTIRLQGTPSNDGKSFTATRVQMLSDSCQGGK